MRVFMDTSVLLAASGSAKGASRYVTRQSAQANWELFSSPWCIVETERNLDKLGKKTRGNWETEMKPFLKIVPNALTSEWILTFPKTKDRPVLLSALAARCEILLTLDLADFQKSIGRSVYGMVVMTPGEFLVDQRKKGVIS